MGDATTIFCPKFFVAQCRKISLGNILTFQKNSVIEIFHAQEGGITILRPKFCVAQCRKSLQRDPLVFHFFRVFRSFIHKKVCHDFFPIFLSHSTEKLRR